MTALDKITDSLRKKLQGHEAKIKKELAPLQQIDSDLKSAVDDASEILVELPEISAGQNLEKNALQRLKKVVVDEAVLAAKELACAKAASDLLVSIRDDPSILAKEKRARNAMVREAYTEIISGLKRSESVKAQEAANIVRELVDLENKEVKLSASVKEIKHRSLEKINAIKSELGAFHGI